MDRMDDHPARRDTMNDSYSLKRKRPNAGDYFDSTEPVKRHDSRPSMDLKTNERPHFSDREMPFPDRPRDRSRSANGHSPFQENGRQYSPKSHDVYGKERVGSRVGRGSSPHTKRHRDDGHGGLEGSSRQHQVRSPERDRDRTDLNFEGKHHSHERNEIISSGRDYNRRSSEIIPLVPIESEGDYDIRMRTAAAADYKRSLDTPSTGRNEDLSNHCMADRSIRDMNISAPPRHTTTNNIDYASRQSPRAESYIPRFRSSGPTSKDTTDPIRDLMTILGQFAENVAEQSSLKLQKDSLKKHVDKKRADLEKSNTHYTNFPAIAETQKATIQKAQEELDLLETGLSQKQVNITQIIQKIAERVVRPNQWIDGRSLKDLKDRVDSLATALASFESRFENENKKWSDAQANWGITKNNQLQLYKKFDELMEVPDKLRKVISNTDDDLTGIRCEVSKISTRVNEALANNDASTANSFQVSEFVNGVTNVVNDQEEMGSISSATNVNNLKNDIENIKTDIEALKKEVYGDRSDGLSSREFQELQRTESEEKMRNSIRQIQNWIKEDTGKGVKSELTAHVEILREMESRLTTVENSPLAKSNGRDNISSAVIEKLENEQKALSESQDAVGEELDRFAKEAKGVQDAQNEVKKEVHSLKTALEAHNLAQNQHREQIDKDILDLRRDAHTIQQGVIERIENATQQSPTALHLTSTLDTRLAGLEGKFSVFQQNFDDSFSALSTSLAGLQQNHSTSFGNLHLLSNSVEGLKVGQSNLDARMNNISTESLARQMLGQLESVYPNLRNVEQNLTSFTTTTTRQATHNLEVDVRLSTLEQQSSTKIASIEGISHKELEDITGNVAAIKSDLEGSKKQFEASIIGLAKNIGNMKADIDQLQEAREKAQAVIENQQGVIENPNQETQELELRGHGPDKDLLDTNAEIVDVQKMAPTPSYNPPTTSGAERSRVTSHRKDNILSKASGLKRGKRKHVFEESDDD